MKTGFAVTAVGLSLALFVGLRGNAELSANPADDPAITDGEIAMIAVVAGGIDVQYAHLALALSKNSVVRDFATTMVQDHPSVNEQAGALVSRLGITPVESDVSRKLQAQAVEIVDDLAGLRGADFDLRYAENELAYHEFVNTALREQFIPGAQNAEFKAALEGALVVFEGHERLARSMVERVKRMGDQ